MTNKKIISKEFFNELSARIRDKAPIMFHVGVIPTMTDSFELQFVDCTSMDICFESLENKTENEILALVDAVALVATSCS
tara:strand:+ start:51330 stop:51569 length:240 start_codon:yes stop_codon:yes gene_type:complete